MKRSAQTTSLTPEGKVFLAFLWFFCGLALLFHENLLLLLGTLVFGASIAAWPLAHRNLRRVDVVRSLPSRARVGRPAPVAWQVRNGSRHEAVGIVVRDPLDGSSRPAALEASFPSAAGRSTTEAATLVDFGRRGVRTLRPALVSSTFPLGLFTVSRVEPAASLLVRPREGVPTRELVARLRGDLGTATTAEVRRFGMDRFHGLREFRDGDDPRRIHWRTTARRGVRTYAEWHAESGRRVTVVLGRAPERGPDADRRFERAVSVAATVLVACARERLPVRLLLGRPPREGTRGAPERGERGVEAALDALARVRHGEERHPGRDLDALERAPGPRTVVWVSSGPEAGVEGRLSAGAGAGGVTLHLRAHEPDLARWVRGLP